MTDLKPDEARTLAQDAYVFGFPVVYIEKQIDRSTAVTKPTGPLAPINQWGHFRTLPDASDRTVVGMNLDVLLSIAPLDLSAEPIVLSAPDNYDRFWNIMWLDAWNDAPHVVGTRASGGKGGDFLIAGPRWEGDVPDGLELVRNTTDMCALVSRLRIEDESETAEINALQDKLTLTPLSGWGTDWQPPDEVPLKPGVDGTTSVPEQVLRMTPDQFFGRLNELLVGNPPRPADAPIMERIAALGVAPREPFPWDDFPPEVQAAVAEGVKAAVQQIKTTPIGDDVNGWKMTLDMGRFGTKYPLRAASTLVAVGGNLVEDACYPLALRDSKDQTLDGAHRYRLRFPGPPPVDQFWSIYIYQVNGFLVENPIGRCMLGSRSDLAWGDDGSLTIAIEAEAPEDVPTSNWLPSPADGPFMVAMRLYEPRPEITDGSWQPPGIVGLGG